MSPIWIPWMIFWGLVVALMIRVFQSVARRDRIQEEAMKLHAWPSSDVIYYIERIQHRRSLGITNKDELEFLKALKLNMAMRGKDLEG